MLHGRVRELIQWRPSADLAGAAPDPAQIAELAGEAQALGIVVDHTRLFYGPQDDEYLELLQIQMTAAHRAHEEMQKSLAYRIGLAYAGEPIT